jgi:hypothetical protein
MTGPVAATRRQGVLLLADISGYTGFLQGVADAHRALIVDADEPPAAYGAMSQLLDTIVTAITPTFRLAKLEGDAVFAVSDVALPDGRAVLETVRRCYAAFRDRLTSAGNNWTCTCDACSRIGMLDLKFVLHHGSFVAQPIAGHEELLGPDVNLAHRLLKNHARDLVGSVPYALLTEAVTRALDIPTADMTAGEETYDGGLSFEVRILALADAPAARELKR